MSRPAAPTVEEILARAARLAPVFMERTTLVPYQAQGVLPSEVLFLWAATGEAGPARIVESGRARAHSTLLLARCFPAAEIVSIDRDSTAAAARAGRARLGDVGNVTLLDGDARALLPALVRAGDVVVIDGPKSFRALALACQLLATRRPAQVFLHDYYRGLPERELLERLLPATRFSDEAQFVDRFAHLDRDAWAAITAQTRSARRPYFVDGVPRASYGPTYACLPHEANTPYAAIADSALRAGFLARAHYVRSVGSRTAGSRAATRAEEEPER